MDARRRSGLAGALVLIGLGVWFLAVQLSPAVRAFAYGRYTWPLPIVGIGAGLFVIGLITWTPGLAIPACIVGGIGGLLYWQNVTGHWASWSYAWSLIPGFVGVGIILAGLMRGRPRGALIGGGWLLLISMVLFGIFGSFLGGLVTVGQLWPVLLIVAGVIVLGTAFLRPRIT
jgi:hypothetical protein